VTRNCFPEIVMDLTPEQQAAARRLFEVRRASTEQDLRALAELLASKSDGEVLGRTEFEVRDRVHRIGAKAIEGALAGRKKGGTKGAASRAANATAGPASSDTEPGDSRRPSARPGTSGRMTTAGIAGPGPPRPAPRSRCPVPT
jgi:hypothetical protein